MLDGVAVIETITVNRIELSLVIALTIMIVGMGSAFSYNSWKSLETHRKSLATTVVSFIAIISIALIAVVWSGYNTYDTEYVVTIDDSVPYKEFVERYEVLEQDGERYRVREVGGE